MNNLIGISGEFAPINLKHQLLMFDNVGIVEAEKTLSHANTYAQVCHIFSELWPDLTTHAEEMVQARNDLEYCLDRGLIFDAGEPDVDNLHDKLGDPKEFAIKVTNALSSKEGLRDLTPPERHEISFGLDATVLTLEEILLDAGRKSLANLIKRWQRAVPRSSKAIQTGIQTIASYFDAYNSYISTASRLISSDLTTADKRVLPLNSSIGLAAQQPNLESKHITSEVVQIVLNHIPSPDDTVPWEDIEQFRNDIEIRGFMTGLRTWMIDLTDWKMTATEANDKIEWLLFQQERYLEAAGISAGRISIGGTFVMSMEYIENILKLRWGKAAENIVSISNRKALLLQGELESPHKELNYLVRARSKFGDPQRI